MKMLCVSLEFRFCFDYFAFVSGLITCKKKNALFIQQDLFLFLALLQLMMYAFSSIFSLQAVWIGCDKTFCGVSQTMRSMERYENLIIALMLVVDSSYFLFQNAP